MKPDNIYPPDLVGLTREALLERARRLSWYHTIDLGGGVVTNGVFDLRKKLHHYSFPEDMTGMKVLDIGRSSGFFSFEFERRGARVTATELPERLLDKEYVGGPITRGLLRRWFRSLHGADFARAFSGEDFFVAHRLLNSTVIPVTARLTDVSPELFGGQRFDLVFVGSVLNHVKDPAGSLERVFGVTNRVCIIANPIDAEDESEVPRMRLVGLTASSLTGWWLPNVTCLVELTRAAGFQDVRVVSRDLVLRKANGGKGVPHAVIHAWRRPDLETEGAFAKIMNSSYPGIDTLVFLANHPTFGATVSAAKAGGLILDPRPTLSNIPGNDAIGGCDPG